MVPLIEEACESRAAPHRALALDAERIALACRDMAQRFHAGGRLLTFGNGTAAADAGHLAVEFSHPVGVGKRALPAISLAGDAAAVTGLARLGGQAAAFSAQLRLLGGPGDVAVGIVAGDPCENVRTALAAARELGMLTVALTGQATAGVTADHLLAAGSDDPLITRELHVTTYHLLWELVHMFFEHSARVSR
ncbi:phosphoheptose isomerase [Microtetraspora sp. NBRC 13810]|uniref:D-sedoheptulose-7-phosphate isomerase n=1 Tax=Microtetraspora sp. NBRC 13810 TaxID=3030990 RepID=UPI0024A4B973|nr:SIS domain-containing protein [Microtetraspora sp. NBRC 13810]GLW09266.1 phosphoheptose isomerase [Microtetraspora sp. NBRC 13810]